MYYVYLLRCADNSLYCGQTTDLDRRVAEHNGQGIRSAKYTKMRQPVHICYSETYDTVGKALKREWEIKKLTKSKKESLVKNQSETHG